MKRKATGGRFFIFLGFIAIFMSVFSTLFVFESFMQLYLSGSDLFMTALFCISVVASFALLDILMILYMLRLLPFSFKPSKKERIEELKEKKKELIKLKENVENKYYKRELDRKSFQNMLTQYERKISETDAKLNRLKRGKKS